MRMKADSVAQLVEHITFNDGVLGSSPSGITFRKRKIQKTPEYQLILGVFLFYIPTEYCRINQQNGGEIGGLYLFAFQPTELDVFSLNNCILHTLIYNN